MKIFHYYIILVYSLILLASCDRTQNVSEVADLDDYFDMDFEALAKRYVPLDTIPLSDSIHYFNYDINIDRIKENKITAAQIPNLRLYMIDSLGNVLQKITQAGNAPGMLGKVNFALTSIDDSENIFVLTTGNAYRLFMFDSDYNHIHTFNLFNVIDEFTVNPVNNTFKLSYLNNNTLSVVMSVGSTVYPKHSIEFFENASSIVKFIIDLSELEIIDHAKHLLYRDLPEIKEALTTQSIWWNINGAVFDFSDGHYYLTYPFSRKAYVYDNDFNLVDTVDFRLFQTLSRRRFKNNMREPIIDVYDRTIAGMRLQLENLNIQHIDIKGNYLLIQFPEILKENGYSLPSKDEMRVSNMAPAQHLNAIIKNLETGEEKLITLPPDFHRIHIIDWDTFYGFHISKEKEFNALIKFRYE